MNDPNNHASRIRPVDAEQRRWLIGIGISVAFGTFGAVMAWLSYTARTRPPAPTRVQVTSSAGDESTHPGVPRRRKTSEHR
jgi:hypothetical protein